MDAAERLLEKLVAGEGWSWELHELLNTVTMADMTFCAFKPYINICDPGGPYKTHTITKEARHLSTLYWQIKRQGKTPTLVFKDGDVFHPWRDYKRHIYGPEHIAKHMYENQVTYYTSGTCGLGMIYNDVDAHQIYQTDEYDGLGILRELFPDAYYRASRRGQNQYLKVRHSSPEQFNALCDKVQEKVRLLFLARGILCDFETKGKITTANKSGSLAKLPFTTLCPCDMRDDTDGWGCGSLIRFHTSPIYTVQQIEAVLDSIVSDGEAVMAMAQRKESLKKLEREPEPPKRQPEADESSNTTVGMVEQPMPEQPQPQREAPSFRNATAGIIEDRTRGIAEGDAFKRNWEDLLPYVRRYFKSQHTQPTKEEALAYLHENGLYSGAWEDGAAGRRNRVASILDKIAEGFDETKLGTGEHQELNPPKFGWWVRQHFGAYMRATVEKRNCFDAETMTYPKRIINVPLHFVCGFLAAAEIAVAKLENGRVSTNWFKDMFKQMGIAWNQDYYRATRDKLHAMGVIQITDRHHKKKVAWKWSRCFNIPASWREEQRALKAKLVKGEEEELPSFFPVITVYTNEDKENNSEVFSAPPRPPPDDEAGAEMWFDETFFEMIDEEGLS